jgi:hypothetical protein
VQGCLDVCKRIVLWACMQVPQLVVDDLMAECAQLISEELPSNLQDPRKYSHIPLLSLSVRPPTYPAVRNTIFMRLL